MPLRTRNFKPGMKVKLVRVRAHRKSEQAMEECTYRNVIGKTGEVQDLFGRLVIVRFGGGTLRCLRPCELEIVKEETECEKGGPGT